MKDKRSTFPLPLSSVTGGAHGKQGKGVSYSPAKVATPQTATRNAACPGPITPYAAPDRHASPSKSHGESLARYQPVPMQAPRGDLMVSDAIRRAMVTRVARQGVQDQMVLGALEAVLRHRFIDEALSAQAYIDASLPIGHSQTISQPYIVGRMIEVMRNGGQLGNVLEIGTGCGYQGQCCRAWLKWCIPSNASSPCMSWPRTTCGPCGLLICVCITEMVCLACRKPPRLTVSSWPRPVSRCLRHCSNSCPSEAVWWRQSAPASSICNWSRAPASQNGPTRRSRTAILFPCVPALCKLVPRSSTYKI